MKRLRSLWLLLALWPSLAAGQTPVNLSIGALRTEAERAAVRFVVDVASAISGADVQLNAKNGLLYLSPDIRIESGEDDAFNSIVAKVVGSVLFFQTVDVGGIPTPDTRFFHALPVSAGIEADRGFENIAFLGEFGYVPWFQGAVPRALKTSRVGVFVQGGYKAAVDPLAEAEEMGPSGARDESAEAPNSGLFRFKASAKFAPEVTLSASRGIGLGVVGSGDLWWDVVNSEIYHRLEATFRIRVATDRYVDFSYQNGSGAPNFNEGDQFSANLTVTF
jgi:hypothetical protein